MEANKDNLHLYNTNLQPFANDLRKRMTKAEACLWKFALRASQLKEYPFRRQRPVLNYIADFMCKDLMLIIEVDGITHHDEKVIENDKRRQAELERAGFTVLRFTDNEVLKGIAGVIAELEEWIEKQEANKSHPQPPPAGDTLGVID
jgi:very-short-patch-repair endonuclease